MPICDLLHNLPSLSLAIELDVVHAASLLEHLFGAWKFVPTNAGATSLSRFASRSSFVQTSIERKSGGQLAVLRQMIEHGLPVVSTISQEVEVALLRVGTQELKQRNSKLWACLVGMIRFRTDLGPDVKAKKEGQAQDSVGAKREANQDTKRNPIVPQAGY